VQASEYGKAFSDVNLTIDPATGDIVEKNADIVWVDDSKVAPDPAVSSILAKYQDLIAPKLNEVEGIAAIDMKGGYASKGPVGDNALGDMLADGMRFVMNSDFALMNGGGIRDNLKQGPITWNELFNIQPFANTLVKLEIKGSDLRTILNAQISSFGPDYSISGFRYTWDGNTGKVVNIYLPDGKTKIDETKTYTITVNDFMATSTGSKYLPIGAAGKNPVQGPEDLAASVDYVKHFNGTPIFYTADGRISQVDGSTTPEGDGTVKVESGQVAEVENNGVLTVDVSGYDENQTTVALTAGQVAALIGKKAAIDVTNGDLVLHLPAENLQADLPLELMITKRTDLSSDSVLGTMYDFKLKQGENFISQFSTPVTLTFTVDAKAVSNPDNVKIYYYNEESKQWELIGGTYANGKISAATSHFSTYAVMEVTASDNQGGSNGDGQGGNGSGQDGNGSGQGTGSSGQGGNNNGQGTSSNGQGTQQQGQQSAGNSLPNTATNSYNLLLLGILLLAAGTGFYIRKRKTL
jgi:LPXTG-motif cell wall-anchored protein